MVANLFVQVASALTSTGWAATFQGLRGVRRELHVLQRSLGKAQPLQQSNFSAARSRGSRTLNPLGTVQARAWSFQVRLLAMPACGVLRSDARVIMRKAPVKGHNCSLACVSGRHKLY